jgi:hypothetical protein
VQPKNGASSNHSEHWLRSCSVIGMAHELHLLDRTCRFGKHPNATVPFPREVNEEETLISLLPPFFDCVLPDDNVPDESVTPRVAERPAVERCPMRTLAVPTLCAVASVFTGDFRLSAEARLNQSDLRITAKLDQPLGKENLMQCFYSAPSLRHVLLPLWKSRFLAGCAFAWRALCAAHCPARALKGLLQEHGTVCFQPLRG